MTLNERIIELIPEIATRNTSVLIPAPFSGIINYRTEHITLADVLRAISFIGEWNIDGLSGSGIHIACTSMGHFVDGYGNSLEGTWNLTTDLDGQSPETKAFISKILGV